jgi:hypothetical protein
MRKKKVKIKQPSDIAASQNLVLLKVLGQGKDALGKTNQSCSFQVFEICTTNL